jgi:hypothetical protein
MNLLKLARIDQVPPGAYRFTVPETGLRIDNCHVLQQLFDKVEQHYNDNSIPLPSNWRELVVDQLCRQLPEGWCYYSDGKQYDGNTPILSFENIMKGITSLSALAAEAVVGGDPFVDSNEAEERAKICTRCYYNQKSNFCMGCGGASVILDMVGKVRGQRKTSLDYMLQNCGICGCRNDAIIHVKKNILLKGEKEETTNKRPDWCWLKADSLSEASSQLHL